MEHKNQNRQEDIRATIMSLLKKYPIITTGFVSHHANCHFLTAEKMLLRMCAEGTLKMVQLDFSGVATFYMQNELYATWLVVNEEVKTDGILPE